MKNVNIIAAILLVVMAGCGGNSQIGNESKGFLLVDVTKTYPEKELILQDVMDVEYIALETTDEFLCQGFVQDIGKNIIVVQNQNQDGDIFLFDRKGKGIKKINRRGQTDEEYTNMYTWGVSLDEDRGEIFVNDIVTRRILVYDLDGNFQRSFGHKFRAKYLEIFNFDSENLMCFEDAWTHKGQSFAIISKQDGTVTKEIEIPFEEKKTMRADFVDDLTNMPFFVTPDGQHPIVPNFNNWSLVEPSSDTIYSYSPDHTMKPFIARVPSVQSMKPEVFLAPTIITDRYYFMELVKKEFDISVGGFKSTDLMYDRQKKSIFRFTVYNEDYSGKKRPVNMKSRPVSKEIATWQKLEVGQLIEDYKKGILKGKLKEIAATLDEKSNPVIMLIKNKK